VGTVCDSPPHVNLREDAQRSPEVWWRGTRSEDDGNDAAGYAGRTRPELEAQLERFRQALEARFGDDLVTLALVWTLTRNARGVLVRSDPRT
jgi:hypothetical protein